MNYVKEEYEFLVNHVFFPIKLPENNGEHFLEYESFFLHLVKKCLNQDLNKLLIENLTEFEEIIRIFDKWSEAQYSENIDPKILHKQINELQENQTFVLYLRNQNATIIIKVLTNQHSNQAIFSSFMANPKNENIMTVNGDLITIYPSYSCYIKNKDMLNSEIFSDILADLNNNPIEECQSHTKKGGVEVEEVRDVQDPKFVIEWLSALIASDSPISNCSKSIRKKIRNEIAYCKGYKPFRRSGKWMSIKVVLNLNLINLFGEHDGLTLYKILIIQIIEELCNEAFKILDPDLVLQMSKKLARRLYKLDFLIKELKINENILKLAQKIISKSSDTIKKIRKHLNTNHNNTIQKFSHDAKLNLDIINYISDFIFKKDAFFYEEICRLESIVFDTNKNDNLKVENIKRNFPEVSFPNINHLNLYDLYKNKSVIQLYDIEYWVLYSLDKNLMYGDHDFSVKLFNLFKKYIDTATKFYINDELGYSRSILTSIKIICYLDMIATKEFPMLKEHKLGIDYDPLEKLLLTNYSEMKIAYKLKDYIEKRNKYANHPSLIEAVNPLNRNLFSVKYCAINEEMKNFKKKIINHVELDKQYKRIEVNSEKLKYNNLIEKSKTVKCPGIFSDLFGICEKCKLTNQANNMFLDIYECPFPDNEISQNIIVFELRMPLVIGILRDLLHLFNANILKIKNKGNEIYGNWVDYNILANYSNRGNLRASLRVGLASDSKSFNQSHYRRNHIRNPIESFILPNGYNINLSDLESRKTIIYVSPDYKDSCTLKASEPYNILQWSVNTTNHVENEVLSKQSTCPKELDLKEFIRFGFFRAGHRLQLKNLLTCLEERSLSFNQLGVYSLVAQSLWELGPLNDFKYLNQITKIYPDSHSDFGNQEYVQSLEQVLSSFISSIDKKWNDQLILLNLVIILNRAVSLSSNNEIINKMVSHLRNCRHIAFNWQDKIEALIQSFRSKSYELENLKIKLLEICCITILTYDVEKRNAHLVISTNEDIFIWLKSISKITYFNSLFGSISSENKFLINLIRRVEICMIQIEDEYSKFVEENNKKPLTDYIKKIWAESSKGKFGEWSVYDKNCYTVEFSCETTIQLYICINGEFLVDGDPVGLLPNRILQHDLYVSYFNDYNFKVYPSTISKGIFVTEEKDHNNQKSSFTFIRVNEYLLIYEDLKDENKEEKFLLIPKNVFQNNFSYYFVNDYSHWLNIKNKTIEFRSNTYTHNYHEIYFIFDMNSMKLSEVNKSNTKYLIDKNSKTFKEIHNKITSRIELENYVHMFHYSKKISIELKRLGLNFEIDMDNSQILSKEYSGMIVSNKQELNTLIGLNKGLILCKSNSSKYNIKNQFIVPHGEIYYNEYSKRIDINIENINEPAFFSYDVDFRLQKLKAGESLSAWLYLACLHGYTSQILPDPFTGLTGTEMSLDILQSGYCWSCKPLTQIEERILKKISNLTPDRKYYPKHERVMQSVNWPLGIPSLAAHEAYKFIVGKILKDSKRISFAYGKVTKNEIKNEEMDIFLNKRAYNKNKKNYTTSFLLNYNFESCISREENREFNYNFNINSIQIKNVRIISNDNYLNYLNKLNFKIDLIKFLCEESLVGLEPNDISKYSINDIVKISKDFKNNWINLYNFSKNATAKKEKDRLKLIISILCYEGIDIEDLLIFRLISDNHQFFYVLNSPQYLKYKSLSEFQYNRQKLYSILCMSFISLEDLAIVNGWDLKLLHNLNYYKNQYENIKQSKIEEQLTFYSKFKEILEISEHNYDSEYFNYMGKFTIENLFDTWKQNRELREFLKKVQHTYDKILELKRFLNNNIIEFKSSECTNLAKNFNIEINYDLTSNDNEDVYKKAKNIYSQTFSENDLINNLIVNSVNNEKYLQEKSVFVLKNDKTECKVTEKYFNDLENSWLAYHEIKKTKIILNYTSLIDELKKIEANLNSMVVECWNFTKSLFGPKDIISNVLNDSDLWPRIVPIKLFKYLIFIKEKQILFDEKCFKYLIGVNGVLMSKHQRIKRCITLAEMGDSMQNALRKELMNTPHQNWSPFEQPEWLLFEIESDCTIRKIQVEVARKMINSPDNTVLQLNMGEGKTSVIIPLLITSLANGDNLVRIIVLNSLFNVNFSSLVQKLGGLLNKRVYVFPCSRDISFSVEMIWQYQHLYEECKANKDVVLALPEYCLSFKLKGVEMCESDDKQNEAEALINTQMWLDNNTRDVLDESDELLNVKYQLIYTSGNTSIVSGGELRWNLAQDVIFRAKYHFKDLNKKYGENFIEYIPNDQYPQAYPTFRLLESKPLKELCEKICKDILESRGQYVKLLNFKDDEMNSLLNFILNEKVKKKDRSIIRKLVEENSNLKNICLILRGYCAYDILYYVFSKRYRVDYGLNVKNKRLLQAVPFRAKDTPAQRSQFSHPDISILLTVLSYYYNGLDMPKFSSLFENLEKNDTKNDIYSNWIELLPAKCSIDQSIKDYSGINLSDSSQLNNLLFPLFKLYPLSINYWLNAFLFPREAKEFTELLGTSSWDLCEIKPKPTTGFSGTNDSRLLLPLTINYYDIPELKYTNGSLISHLTDKENNNYIHLRPMQNSIEMLGIIAKKSIKLLLDVGALTIGSNNQEIALTWLNIDKKAEAAVYFDENNSLVVINREKKVNMFEASPFKNELGRCIVYLDEYHTRGTDLKFPKGTIGAVTLGKNVTKDKLMQACMRMRMLGDGHSVCFFASNEVHLMIKKNSQNDNEITSLEVIKWAINNSRDQIVNGFLYWGIQGLSYYQRLLALVQYKNHQIKKKYYDEYKNRKCIELTKFYDNDRVESSIVDIIEEYIKFHKKNLTPAQSNIEMFDSYSSKMLDMLVTYVENKKKRIHLFDEELEIELEEEQEEEFEVQRPTKVDFYRPTIHQDVVQFVKTGHINQNSSSFIHLPKSLKNSSLKDDLQENAWSSRLFVTDDFIKTVKHHLSDDFFRPPKWVATSSSDISVVLSAYEANELVNCFDQVKVKLSFLAPRNRKSQKRIFELDKSKIVISPLHMEQLAIFSGSLYLNNENEQSAYLSFLGYCPSPRTEIEEEYFNLDYITRSGYVHKDHRIYLGLSNCGFETDPILMIKKLADIRNYGVVPKSASHLVILNTGKKP